MWTGSKDFLLFPFMSLPPNANPLTSFPVAAIKYSDESSVREEEVSLCSEITDAVSHCQKSLWPEPEVVSHIIKNKDAEHSRSAMLGSLSPFYSLGSQPREQLHPFRCALLSQLMQSG